MTTTRLMMSLLLVVCLLGITSCRDSSDLNHGSLDEVRTLKWSLQVSYPVGEIRSYEGARFTPVPPKEFVAEFTNGGRSMLIPGLEDFTPVSLQTVSDEYGGGFAGNAVTYHLRLHFTELAPLLFVRVRKNEGELDLLAVYAVVD